LHISLKIIQFVEHHHSMLCEENDSLKLIKIIVTIHFNQFLCVKEFFFYEIKDLAANNKLDVYKEEEKSCKILFYS
jgi:hypothetical protein